MTTTELILAFAGTSVGAAIVGGWINKERSKIEIDLRRQSFYKILIEDMKKERVDDMVKIDELTKEVKSLKTKVLELIKINKEDKKTIEKLRNGVKD